MGRNAVQATGSKGRADLMKFAPEQLTIITDPTHPLYDPRESLPLAESFILNIKALGVLQPIIVRRNGERDGVAIMEVVVGRQRVKAAREANARLRAEGAPEILVPAIVKRDGDAQMFATIVAENEARQNDSPMARAHKMARLLAFGVSTDEAAVVFNVSRTTARNIMALLDLAPAAQAAVEAGELSATIAAQELAKLPREEQAARLDSLRSTGAHLSGDVGRENIRRAGGAGLGHAAAAVEDAGAEEPAAAPPRMVTRRRVEAAIKVLPRGKGAYQDGFRAALDWVSGGKPRGGEWAEMAATLRAAEVLT